MALGGGESGGGKAAGDVRAGGAFVEIFAEDSKLQKTLRNTKKDLEGFGGTISKIGFASLASDVAQLTAIGKLFKDAVENAVEMKSLGRATGESTEQVSRLAFAFQTVGISADGFTQIVEGLQSKLFAAIDGSDELFVRLGINARALAKMPLDAQFKKLGEQLQKVPEGLKRNEAATQLFGRNAGRVLRLLADGPEKFAAAMAKAQAAGIGISEEQAAAAEKIEEVWHTTLSTLKNGLLEVGRAFFGETEDIDHMASSLQKTVNGITKWIRENKKMVVELAIGTATFIAVDLAVIALGASITGLGIIIGAVGSGIVFIGSALALLFTPVGILLGLVAGLAVVFITGTKNGQMFVERLGRFFGELGKSGTMVFNDVAEAIKRGELEVALQNAGDGLEMIWGDLMDFLSEEWHKFLDGFLEGLKDTLEKAGNILLEKTPLDKAIEGSFGPKLDAAMPNPQHTFKMGPQRGGLSDKMSALADEMEKEGKAGTGRKYSFQWLGAPPAGWVNGQPPGRKYSDAFFGMPPLDLPKPEPAKPETDKERRHREYAEKVASRRPKGHYDFFDELLRGMVPGNKPRSALDVDIGQLPARAKGMFQSPNYAGSLGIGDSVGKESLVVERNQLGVQQEILAAVQSLPGPTFK